MSEINKLPIPLNNYLRLIRRKESPYYDLICYIITDMERDYTRRSHPSVIYTINPRQLKEEIEEKLPRHKKLTTINITRTILALLHGSKLQRDEDYYVTTSSGGRKNYHIKVNPSNLTMLQMHI